ncbi:ATP-binding cassette domain-containing protein [Salinicola tamaricis]|uniref:ATP-binding cassette domain-containing protein n=1 Tax=Salinicola tamaricis TaxID=1771309 RepID=UPI001F5C2006|nr:ATP-binding cassette domain-containing protein [Salinicola tamaricis]
MELEAVELSHVGRQQVLGPLSLRVETGEVVALIGPSGSGKSSLLQLIAGFVAADAAASRWPPVRRSPG